MDNYITNITIKNYRSCRKTNLDLNVDLTVLIGKNGTGKTNILNALLLLKQLSKNSLSRRHHSDDSFLNKCEISLNFHQKKTVTGLKFYFTYDIRDKNSDVVLGAYVSVKKEGGKKWSKKTNIDNINSFMNTSARYRELIDEEQFSLNFKKLFDVSPDEEETFPIVSDAISYFGKIEYFGATQFSDPSQCPVVLEIGERGRRTPYGFGDYHNQFLNDLYLTSEESKLFFKDYIDFVSDLGLNLISGIEFKSQTIESNSYEVRTGGSFRKTKKDKKIVIPYVGVDGLNLSFNQLSEGTFKTLALVFYILKSENNLMIIEEPEVCIHHGLLNSIMELVKEKSKESQMIVSTHSDYMLDKLEPENIVLVEKNGEFGTSANLLTKKLSSNDYKALKNYLQDAGNLGDYWKEGGFAI